MNSSKMCWWITEKCNENCEYCFKPLSSINNFTYEDHMKILKRIISFDTDQITWTGEEALLVPHAISLMKYAKEHRIYNKITTNGKLLTKSQLSSIFDWGFII